MKTTLSLILIILFVLLALVPTALTQYHGLYAIWFT